MQQKEHDSCNRFLVGLQAEHPLQRQVFAWRDLLQSLKDVWRREVQSVNGEVLRYNRKYG